MPGIGRNSYKAAKNKAKLKTAAKIKKKPATKAKYK